MTFNSLCALCRLPHATEKWNWGENLVFYIGGKMFALISKTDGALDGIAWKCSPEDFDRLIQIEGIIPAPYSARMKWVKMVDFLALEEEELAALIRNGCEIVKSSLPKKIRETLA